MKGFPSLVSDAASVVVKGKFNPAIFSPAWLLYQGLIGSSEFDDVKIQIIADQAAIFQAGWLQVQVTPDNLQLLTNEPAESERVRDVAVGILRSLEHTPIGQLGLNRQVAFSVQSRAEWHAIGDRLAPKEPWEGVLNLPGMHEVTIWGIRPDSYAGRIQVQVQPAYQVPHGIYVACNDHYELTTVEEQPATRESFQPIEVSSEPSSKKIPIALSILDEQWSASMTRATIAIQRICELSEV